MKANNIREFDEHAVVKNFNYNDVDHYYAGEIIKGEDND